MRSRQRFRARPKYTIRFLRSPTSLREASIIFGLDESANFEIVGVYDPQDLQKRIGEMGLEMEPIVRPATTVHTFEDGKSVVAAEIPPLDLSERPCFKRAAGRLQGSYVRVGDSDQRMTEYEVYAFEAYRKRIREDQRQISIVGPDVLDPSLVQTFVERRTRNRPNISASGSAQMMELLGITRNGAPTLMSLLMFGRFPQAPFPELSIEASRVPGTEIGEVDADGSRFVSSRRIEGTLPEMLDGAVDFVAANMRMAVGVDQTTGKRFEVPEYPLDAVREIVLNALIHRDYSVYTESEAIQLQMFSDRIEVQSPGGLYGHLSVEDLGFAQPETRNQSLVTAMERMGYIKNRRSGIPRIRRLMKEAGLPDPVFESQGGRFTARLYNNVHHNSAAKSGNTAGAPGNVAASDLLAFCAVPRSRSEIAQHLGVKSRSYAMRRYIAPLVESSQLQLSIPGKPKSPLQRYTAVAGTTQPRLPRESER